MNINVPTPDKAYKVLVICFTYNHSIFISDALKGFSMQETDFPFICIVIDDASIDNNQDAIRRFANDHCDMTNAYISEDDVSQYIRTSHKTNVNCVFLFCLLKVNLFGKPEKQELYRPYREVCEYEALCEGDDYWTVAKKLQKQVDWLKFHENCQMCCSDAHIITPEKELDWARYDKDTDVSVEDMITGGGLYVQTCTLLRRRSLMLNYPECCSICHVGDYPLQIWAALNGGVHYFAEKTGVYRYATNNSWTARSKTLDIEAKFDGVRSEIEMLRGLDSYSQYKYHKAFEKRQSEYIYRFAIYGNKGLRESEDVKKVISSFEDVYNSFSLSQKLDVFFLSHSMLLFFRIKRKVLNLIKNM